jgi:hypothetical protein
MGLGLNVIYFTAALIIFRRIFEAARNRGLLVKIQ